MALADLTAGALALVSTVVQSLRDAHAGTITPDQARAQIAAAHAELDADRAAADAALAARFAGTTP